MYILRTYQKEAIDKAVECISNKKNGIIVAPTGSGKSIIIAGIVTFTKLKTIVLQPTKEILEQNLSKLTAVDSTIKIGVYSSSMGVKQINNITFATIGSVINKKELFELFELIIVDECHCVNSKGGMYESFINSLGIVTIGLTATPYRLRSYRDMRSNDNVAESRILTRTRPRIFDEIIHITQIKTLFDEGYLCQLDYEYQNNYDSKKVRSNSTNAGFDDNALEKYNKEYGIVDKVVYSVLNSSSRACLVFTQFCGESKDIVEKLNQKGYCSAEVSGKTQKKHREDILHRFKNGDIKCVVNVGVLTTGFDFPELDCVVIARPTKSLALFYQIIGRGVRTSKDKTACKIFDICDNVKRFGKIETFVIEDINGNKMWRLKSNIGYLTGVDVCTGKDLEQIKRRISQKDKTQINSGDYVITFGKNSGKKISEVNDNYLEWCYKNFNTGKLKEIIKLELDRRATI